MAQGPKQALKDVQGGKHVAEKNFSSAKKETKADGVDSTKPSTYEGSSEDWSNDWATARRRGMSTEDHENSARDRISDAAGERRMAANTKTEESTPTHKPGVSAFANSPKSSHGFGHTASSRDGHLRNSGHSGAHRIGKKR